MSEYTESINWYAPEPRKDKYFVVSELVWEVQAIGTGMFVRVPVGFLFDVSVPWYARWLIDPDDHRFMKASCLHDYLLEQGVDRMFAAAVFSNALRADGVSRVKRLIMTVGVVVFKFR